ncbi:hypothetical protein ABIE53_001178 [Burkholderia sp. OAS925]
MREQRLEAPRGFFGLTAAREQADRGELAAAARGHAEFVVRLLREFAAGRGLVQLRQRRLGGLRLSEAQIDAHQFGEQDRRLRSDEQRFVDCLLGEVVATLGAPQPRGCVQPGDVGGIGG